MSKPREPDHPSDAYTRFIKSMVMDFDMWHDGTGYDLEALGQMTAEEKRQVRQMLTGRTDWRDAEALAALDPPAHADLRRIFGDESTPLVTRLTAGESLEEAGDEVDFTPLILAMLDAAPGDLSVMSRVFDWIQRRHPGNDERVRRKILRVLLSTHGPSAVNFAAVACVVYGLSSSQYDWTDRPFWLRFGEREDHARACAELLEKIGFTREEILRERAST